MKNLGICYRGCEKFGGSSGYGRNGCQQQSVQIAIVHRFSERIKVSLTGPRQLVEAKDELLVCYRVGKQPAEKLMWKLDALREVEGLLEPKSL